MKISTIAVPVGAGLGLLLAMTYFPTNMGIILATLIGGMIGGMVGLYIAQRRNQKL
ncbi:MAG TPA: hypothetical protein P5526_31955 [Anaerolineae bacterium]|nr:hypothetical protein [Anaerolineae bacterium]MCB0224641.1 hypothetical protein [Anaerolineae bacterium]MCB9108749.1 hypothetical protein [Anaerolineales bacterium]HRV96813.1 hypothetical protein [Anaerolineae bacterium]